jgi:hypothetical protein
MLLSRLCVFANLLICSFKNANHPSDGSNSEWQDELLKAVRNVFSKQNESLAAELRTCLSENGDTKQDNSALLTRLQSRLDDFVCLRLEN